MMYPTLESLPGVYEATNIQIDPEVYELENLAADPDGRIETAMAAIAPWDGKVVLDLGAGAGFHLARFHTQAQHIFAVEPSADLRLRAMERVVRLGLERVSILTGSAEYLPLRDASVDICHARFAYFFAPHCAPGLAELARVMRSGGTAFIVDNDLRHGVFAAWLRRDPTWSSIDPTVAEQFWAEHGFACTRIASEWRFANHAELEAVVRLEFGEQLAAQLLAQHEGTRVEYHYCLYHRHYL